MKSAGIKTKNEQEHVIPMMITRNKTRRCFYSYKWFISFFIFVCLGTIKL